MEWGTVSAANIIGMVFSLIVSVGLPIILGIIVSGYSDTFSLHFHMSYDTLRKILFALHNNNENNISS